MTSTLLTSGAVIIVLASAWALPVAAADAADYALTLLRHTGTIYDGQVARVLYNNGRAGSALTEAWYVDGALVRTMRHWLASGEITSVAFSGLPVGTHTIVGVSDSDGNYTEANEANNVISVTVEVLPASQVGFSSFQLAPVASPLPGSAEGLFDVTTSVCNAGPLASVEGVLLLELSTQRGAFPVYSIGHTLPSRTIPALAPGACTSDAFRVDASDVVGDFELKGAISVANDGREPDNYASAHGSRVISGQGGIFVSNVQCVPLGPLPCRETIDQIIGRL